MAARKESESALVAAAKALDQELVAFAAAREALDHAPLASQRHLERAGQLLDAIATSEEQLRLRLGALARALHEADAAREADSQAILRRAAHIEARSLELKKLVAMHRELGARAGEISAAIAARVAAGVEPATLQAIDGDLAGLQAESEALRSAARAADFQDVAKLADSLRDQLQSARARLRKARAAEN
jgi:hypothetical protein